MTYTRQLWSSLFLTNSSFFFWLSVSDETRRLKKAPMGIDAATRKINAGLLKIPSNIPKPETKTAMTPLANPSTMNRRGCLSCRSGEKATIANAVMSGEKKMISWRNSIIFNRTTTCRTGVANTRRPCMADVFCLVR